MRASGTPTRARLSDVIDLREGEGRVVLQTFLTLCGIVAGHTILETARDTLFLTKLPPSRLTLVYAVLAGLALVVSSYNARFVRRFGRKNALVFTLVVAAYGTTLLHFVPQTAPALFVLYVWSGLLGTVLSVQFWMLAGQLFTVAQGKRLFGLIAAGGVFGAVVGASLAAVALSAISVGSLLLVAAALFLATSFHLASVPAEDIRPAAAETPQTLAVIPKGIFAVLREQPYLVRIAAFVAVSTAALITTDYLFKTVAAASIPAAQLGTFFARYYAVLNGIALVVQVAVAGRFIRNMGIGPALMVLPLLIAGGATGMLIFGSALGMAMLTKGADGSLRHSLQRVATELLWMPLPGDIRDRGKALVDTVFGRLVQALMAGILLLLATLGLSSTRLLAAIVLGLTITWMTVTVRLRRPYLDLFRRALRRGSLDAHLLNTDLDLSSVEALMEALSSRNSALVIAAMEVLSERNRTRLIPGLVLYHESPEVLVRALPLISQPGREDWVPLTERLLTHPVDRVRIAAIDALGQLGAMEGIERIADDESPTVRAHAAFYLAHREADRDPRTDPRIAELLALGGDAGRAARVALLDAIQRLEGTRWADVVLEMLGYDDAEVVEHAAMAMTRTQDERFIPHLVARLRFRDGRTAVREALVSHGEPAFTVLVEALRNAETDPRTRVHVPRVLAAFGTQGAADVLFEQMLVEPSGTVRYKILRALGRLAASHKVKLDRAVLESQMRRNLFEHLRLLSLSVALSRAEPGSASGVRPLEGAGKLILGLLGDKQKQSLERAFRLLQIVHRNEDIRTVYITLNSDDGRRRAHALEFLDALMFPSSRADARAQADTRELFRLVADDLTPEERVVRAMRYLPTRPTTHAEAVSALLREKDESLAALAAYHALEMGQDELRERVQEAYRQRPTLPLKSSLDVFGLMEEALGVG